jgi:hypothetical protein
MKTYWHAWFGEYHDMYMAHFCVKSQYPKNEWVKVYWIMFWCRGRSDGKCSVLTWHIHLNSLTYWKHTVCEASIQTGLGHPVTSCSKHKTALTEQSSCISVQKWCSLACIVTSRGIRAKDAQSTAAGLHNQSEDLPQTVFHNFLLKWRTSVNTMHITSLACRSCQERYFTLHLCPGKYGTHVKILVNWISEAAIRQVFSGTAYKYGVY